MKIVIEIKGGCLQNVYGPEDCEVELFDWDNIEDEDCDTADKKTAEDFDAAISDLFNIF